MNAVIRDIRISATKDRNPKLRVDLTLASGEAKTDAIVLYDPENPRQRQKYNASTRRLLSLCKAAGVELKAVLPPTTKDSDDLKGLVDALRGKTVRVEIRRWGVRYSRPENGSPPAPAGEAKAADVPAPMKDVPLIYYTSGPHEGELIPCVANALALLAMDSDWADALAWDDFEGAVVALKRLPWFEVDRPAEARWKAGPLTDGDTTRAQAWFARQHKLVLSASIVHDAIGAAAERHVVHPVADYLRSVTWDGIARLDRWLIDYCGADDTPFVRAVSAAWMISGVARIFRPGCQADHMLVLVGDQGLGKSSALKGLVPNENWFNDEFDVETKDGKIALQGVWIIEVAELAGLRKSAIEQIKAALTRQVDKFRAPYGRRDGRYPRQCILAASTNSEEFLQDSTGNRRFWPVKVRTLNVQALREIRDQLWAEARARFELGEPWHLTDAAIITAATEEQEVRLVADPRADIVAEWLASAHIARRQGKVMTTIPRGRRGVTTKEVLLDPLAMPPDRAGQAAQQDAARLLRKCGWTTCGKKHTRGAARPRLFFPEKTGCLACLERWDVGPQTATDADPKKKSRKESGQTGQTGHSNGITKENGAQSR